MDDLLSEFLTETNESLQVLDTELVKLEQEPNSPELLDNIFRVMHTIKGTCGFLGLPRLENVAHAGENVLGRIRDGSLEVDQERVSLILECLDRIREILSVLEETEQEPEGDDSELLNRLEIMVEVADKGIVTEQSVPTTLSGGGGESAQADEASAEPASDAAASATEGTAESGGTVAGDGDTAGEAGQSPAVRQQGESAPAEHKPGETSPEPHVTQAQQESAPGQGASGSRQQQQQQQKGGGDSGQHRESQVASQSIRVSVELLESLMTTVSELVLNRNQLMQILRKHKESEFAAPLQRLNHVVSELQEGVMKTRMQPIGNAWSKLPRLVRDLSKELGKKIELKMKGEDTELDRQVLELIKDPLTHMVRNAADHGLEYPDERKAAGKTETGTVFLNAYHEGGHIIIEIGDDGKGLDPDKIANKALRNGLTTESDLTNLSEQQILQFVFKPGFSTADQVSNVSGRGVGMDVVKSNIESLRGNVRIESEKGKGTAFTLVLPLTMAIIDGMQAKVGDHRYIIPLLSIIQSFKPTEDMIHTMQGKGEMVPFRGNLVPLCRMSRLFNLEGAVDNPTQGTAVVVEDAGRQVAVLVDELLGQTQTVIKSMGKAMGELPGLTGATILSDGTPGLIIDVHGMVNMASGRSHRETQSA